MKNPEGGHGAAARLGAPHLVPSAQGRRPESGESSEPPRLPQGPIPAPGCAQLSPLPSTCLGPCPHPSHTPDFEPQLPSSLGLSQPRTRNSLVRGRKATPPQELSTSSPIQGQKARPPPRGEGAGTCHWVGALLGLIPTHHLGSSVDKGALPKLILGPPATSLQGTAATGTRGLRFEPPAQLLPQHPILFSLRPCTSCSWGPPTAPRRYLYAKRRSSP